MYNRYIRQDDGRYVKVTEEDPGRGNVPPERPAPAAGRQPSPGPEGPPEWEEHPSFTDPPPPPGGDGAAAYLRRVLDQFHLDRIDTGDLLLLGLLYFLFREKADEELLIALGLLLIL